MTNENELRRIIREEIRAAFAELAEEIEMDDCALTDDLRELANRLGKCTAKVDGGYDRCTNDAGACLEHDAPAEHADPDAPVPFTVTTLGARFQEHAPAVPVVHASCPQCDHRAGAHTWNGGCVERTADGNWCGCGKRTVEIALVSRLLCSVCLHRVSAHGPAGCTHETPDGRVRCTCTGLLSAWSTSPITGDDVCTACPHTRSAHASAGCMDCACTTARRAQ